MEDALFLDAALTTYVEDIATRQEEARRVARETEAIARRVQQAMGATRSSRAVGSPTPTSHRQGIPTARTPCPSSTSCGARSSALVLPSYGTVDAVFAILPAALVIVALSSQSPSQSPTLSLRPSPPPIPFKSSEPESISLHDDEEEVTKLPEIPEIKSGQALKKIVIEDSKKGWADSVKTLI